MFHDYDYNGHFMMDMEFGNWFYIILGIVVILLSVIILLYFFFHYSSHTNSKSLQKNQKYESNMLISSITNIEEINSRDANFCHNCGQKLDINSLKFCPYCGEEI